MNKTAETRAMLVAILFGTIGIVAASAISTVPRAGQSIAVITWPGEQRNNAVDVIIKAGGAIKDFGKFSWIAVSDFDEETRVSRLYEAGALVVLDASLVATCLAISKGYSG